MTYKLSRIKPRVDSENRIIAIAFDVELVTGEDVVTDTRPTVEFYPEPLAALDTYSEEQLTTLCDAVVVAKDLAKPKVAFVAPPVIEVPPLEEPTPPTDDELRARWMASIDDTVAVITERFTRFARDYGKRLAAAEAYKAAGYTGDPTTWITRFADNTGITYEENANGIIAKAAEYDAAEEALGNLRMDKYKVLNASSIGAARVIYDGIIRDCNTINAGLS